MALTTEQWQERTGHDHTSTLITSDQVGVPMCMVEQSGLKLRLWVLLSRECSLGIAKVSLAALADELQATRRGVQKALDGLERQGRIIRRSWPGTVTEYALVA